MSKLLKRQITLRIHPRGKNNMAIEDIQSENIIDDIPEPDEIMEPQPVDAQNDLWEYLDAVIDGEAIDREKRFIDLSPEIQQYLASRALATTIQTIGMQNNFSEDQQEIIAGTVKSLFIKDISLNEFDAALAKNLEIDLQKVAPIRTALRDTLAMFEKENTSKPRPIEIAPEVTRLKPMTGKAIPNEKPAATQPQPQEEAIPETPFMIHRETTELPTLPRSTTPRPSFFRSSFNKNEEQKPANTSAPQQVKVKIQTPEGVKEKPKSRVVHYSNLRTPIE